MNAKRKATEAAQTKNNAKISIFLCLAMGSSKKTKQVRIWGKEA